MRCSTALLLSLLLGGAVGCRTKTCDDESIFVDITVAGVAASADHLVIKVTPAGGSTLSDSVEITPRDGARSVAITFGSGGYPKGQQVHVSLEATQNGQVVAEASGDPVLTASCARFAVTLGEVPTSGDGGELADFAGCIPDAPMCPAGQCGQVSDGCGKFVTCSEPCDVTRVSPRLANAGDVILFDGTFAPGATVDFPGAAGVPLTLIGAHRATAVVPAEATAGRVLIHSGNMDIGGGSFRRATYPLSLQDFSAYDPQTSGGHQTPRLATPRKYEALASVNGWIYAIGGSTSTSGSGNAIASVERVRVNSDGTLGWPQTLAGGLTTARYGHCAVVIGNRLYAIGGATGTGSLRSVEWATIMADGSLSAFTEVVDALGTARGFASCTIVGNQLYVVGGINNTLDLTTVERASIAPDGSLGTFGPAASSLATPRHGHVAFATRSQLLVAGGNIGGADTATIESAPIATDGTIGGFAPSATSLPAPTSNLTGVQFGDKLYAMPYLATVAADGTPGPFTVAGNAGGLGYAHSDGTRTVLVRDSIYMLTTSNTDQATYELWVRAGLGKTATLGAFSVSTTSALANPRQSALGLAVGDNLFVLGGTGMGGDPTAIHRAQVNLDDSIGPFTVAQAQLPAARSEAALAVARGRVYLLGGLLGNTRTPSIITAPILPDDSLGPFALATTPANVPVNLPSARSGLIAFVVGDNLCVVGGYTGTGYSNAFECSTIDPDGHLGGFAQVAYYGNTSQTAALVTARGWSATAMLGRLVLAISGASTPSNPTDVETSDVGFVGGTLADKFVSKIAAAVPGGARTFMNTVVVGAGVYGLGGQPTTAATLRLDAQLTGPFVAVPASDLKVPRFGAVTFSVGNYVYIVGGGGSSTLASVEAAPLK